MGRHTSSLSLKKKQGGRPKCLTRLNFSKTVRAPCGESALSAELTAHPLFSRSYRPEERSHKTAALYPDDVIPYTLTVHSL